MQWLGGHISTHFRNCFSGFFGGRKRHKTPLLHIPCIITLAWVLLPRGETSQGTDNTTRIQISHGSNYTGFWCSYFGSSTLICHCIPPTVSHFSELAKRELVSTCCLAQSFLCVFVLPGTALGLHHSLLSCCRQLQTCRRHPKALTVISYPKFLMHALGNKLAHASSSAPCSLWDLNHPTSTVQSFISLSFSFLITLSVASCVSKCTNL